MHFSSQLSTAVKQQFSTIFSLLASQLHSDLLQLSVHQSGGQSYRDSMHLSVSQSASHTSTIVSLLDSQSVGQSSVPMTINYNWSFFKHFFRPFFFSVYSLLEITEKQQQELEKEAKRSHLTLDKTQKTSEKRERSYKAKLEALEKQVIIWKVST